MSTHRSHWYLALQSFKFKVVQSLGEQATCPESGGLVCGAVGVCLVVFCEREEGSRSGES